jgi:S-adenosylmethionine:tRNA ribosyltransferase-isomerase
MNFMLTSDFDYNLPKELIAQYPAEPRDSSRLMVVNKEKQTIEHRHFFELLEYLRPGDLLVWNNSKVFKARLRGVIMADPTVAGVDLSDSSGVVINLPKVEIFLLRPMENFGVWKALAKPAKKLRLGMKVVFAEDYSCEIITKEPDGSVLVQFGEEDTMVREKANRYGEVPTPPYVRVQKPDLDLNKNYQTIYAKIEGSVAAPTAGFHFTNELIQKIKSIGVEFAEVTLHVSLGTFQPVKEKKIEQHKMHSEWAELTDKNAGLITAAKAEGRRVIAVGTTTARTLEGIAKIHKGNLRPYDGDINIFIYPGFEFQIIDALITNFHLPKSTLIMLVSAFLGNREFLLRCYEEAINQKYRFYSFGDAMFLTP